jgi:UPF0271 protein
MIIDLNCDLGESFGTYTIGNDEAIMPYISSANIACGFHAGDPLTIEKTLKLALKYGVSIGAHPGYSDLEGFGRREMKLSQKELRASILYQVGAIKSMVETLGGNLQHVKPHGALYNLATVDTETAKIIAQTIKEIDKTLILVCLSGSELAKSAKEVGLAYASEVFADRAYNNDGTLVSRNLKGAIIHDTKQVIDRSIQMLKKGTVESITGEIISIQADTICIHGDNEKALEFVKSLRAAFIDHGIEIKSLRKNIG